MRLLRLRRGKRASDPAVAELEVAGLDPRLVSLLLGLCSLYPGKRVAGSLGGCPVHTQWCGVWGVSGCGLKTPRWLRGADREAPTRAKAEYLPEFWLYKLLSPSGELILGGHP